MLLNVRMKNNIEDNIILSPATHRATSCNRTEGDLEEKHFVNNCIEHSITPPVSKFLNGKQYPQDTGILFP